MTRAYGLTMILLAIAASGVVALGQTPNTMGQEDIAKTVSVLDHVWLDAAHNRDEGTLNWLFADNFVEVHPGGEIVNKATQIAQIMQISDAQVAKLELHPDDIQVIYKSADVAVILDTTTIRGANGGVTYNGLHKVIRVFAKQQGRWRAAGAGITRIVP
jgi:ketosteroid isomerase-like protein